MTETYKDKNKIVFGIGFKPLEAYLGLDDYVYVLRYLYQLLAVLNRKNIQKSQIMLHIQRFERTSRLPGFLSALPVEEFLCKLEDEVHLHRLLRGYGSFSGFK